MTTIIDKEGLRRLGITYHLSYLLTLEKKNRFPRRKYLSPVRPVWLLSEVEQWIAEKVKQREVHPP